MYTSGMALCALLLLIMTVLLIIQWRWVGSKQNKFTAVSGRGYAVRPMKLGRWKYVAFGGVLLFIFLSTIVPGIFVVLGSFMKFGGLFMGDWFTLDHWKMVLGDSKTWGYCLNTIILGLGAATGGSLLYFLISYVTVRTKFKGRALLDFVSWLPNIIPGIALALGLLWVYVGGLPFLPFSLYGTIWLLMICLVTARIPYGVRIANGVMVQVSNELEEASKVHGGSWLQTMRHIMIPLLWPGIVSTWLLTFIFAVKETVIVLMLYGLNSKTLSVEMFNLATQSGQGTEAMVIGILETAIVMVVWIAFRFFGRRVGGQDMQVL